MMIVFSCGGGPATQVPSESVPAAQTAASVDVDGDPDTFDPSSISQDIYDSTKSDVQHLIEELNGIIRSKNYNAWKSYLDEDYLADISSSEYLRRISDTAAMKSQKIVLRVPEDYFNYVVVPSRANSRVDDIEFITQRRVKAFTVTEKGQRLRLYDLERSGNGWKIIN
ncbi:MAG: hypothetical protein LBJ24_03000 [Treponema sp.]|nr:hypothetical protein [Treponema sp.]